MKDCGQLFPGSQNWVGHSETSDVVIDRIQLAIGIDSHHCQLVVWLAIFGHKLACIQVPCPHHSPVLCGIEVIFVTLNVSQKDEAMMTAQDGKLCLQVILW